MKRALSLIVILFASSRSLEARPSLKDGDKREYTITVGGQQEQVTVYRDERFPNQWYYVPNKPRLVINRINNRDRPSFNVVGFQFDDPASEQFFTGGFLNFTVGLALPPEGFHQIETAIKAEFNLNQVNLAAVPISNARVYVFCRRRQDDTEQAKFYANFIASSSPGDVGSAPSEATQPMAITLPLTKWGFDLAKDGAEHDNILIAYQFDYECLTPPEGFTVTANWDKLYDFFEDTHTDHKGWSVLGIVGNESNNQVTTMWNSLKTAQCVDVKGIVGKNF